MLDQLLPPSSFAVTASSSQSSSAYLSQLEKDVARVAGELRFAASAKDKLNSCKCGATSEGMANVMVNSLVMAYSIFPLPRSFDTGLIVNQRHLAFLLSSPSSQPIPHATRSKTWKSWWRVKRRKRGEWRRRSPS